MTGYRRHMLSQYAYHNAIRAIARAAVNHGRGLVWLGPGVALVCAEVFNARAKENL